MNITKEPLTIISVTELDDKIMKLKIYRHITMITKLYTGLCEKKENDFEVKT